MKCKLPGLSAQQELQNATPSYLVRVVKAQYKPIRRPYLLLTLSVLEPAECAGMRIVGQIDCRPKSLWKLNWFLRDFSYDPSLLFDDEIDEKALARLEGVVRIAKRAGSQSKSVVFDAFAPAHTWKAAGQPVIPTHKKELAS
jgi:hypothetical protein